MSVTRKWYLILLIFLAACGGGSSSESTPEPAPTPAPAPVPEPEASFSITTLFNKGPVSNANCQLFAVSEGLKGELLISAETNTQGLASFSEAITYQGTGLIECQGGTYVDEFTERRTTSDTPLMRSVISIESATEDLEQTEAIALSFVVSPLTEIAVQLAEAREQSLNTVLEGDYFQAVNVAFGLTPTLELTTQPPIDLLTTIVTENSHAAEYGFALAIIAYLANTSLENNSIEVNEKFVGLSGAMQYLVNDLNSQLNSQLSDSQTTTPFSEQARQEIGAAIDHYNQFGSIINSALQATDIRRNLLQNGNFILPEADPVKTLSITKPIDTIREELVAYIQANELTPLPDAPAVSDEMFTLGQALAFDKILSGNKDVSCISCHHPLLATGDNRSLPLGVGSEGLGQNRSNGRVIARHAQPLFNLDLFENMFWDGRVELTENGELSTPANQSGDLTQEMASVFFATEQTEGFTGYGVVAAQAMFPVADSHEMRGEPNENNELANFASDDFQGIWQALMARLGEIDEYVTLFESAYPNIKFEQMSFAHAANAIAAFEISAFNFRDNPWQQVIADVTENGTLTNPDVFDENTTRGAHFFFETGCINCHKGSVMSDFDFHAISSMQFGPGKGDGDSGFEDFGRERITGNIEDRAKFRTAPLLNIDLTAPYAHLGQFGDLWSHIQIYAIPERFWINLFSGYDRIIGGFVHEPDFENQITENEKAIFKTFPVPSFNGQAYGFIRTEQYNDTKLAQVMADSGRLTLEEGKRLGDNELRLHRQILVPFMQAQTDPRARNLSRFIPESVPSGLAVENSL